MFPDSLIHIGSKRVGEGFAPRIAKSLFFVASTSLVLRPVFPTLVLKLLPPIRLKGVNWYLHI